MFWVIMRGGCAKAANSHSLKRCNLKDETRVKNISTSPYIYLSIHIHIHTYMYVYILKKFFLALNPLSAFQTRD